tara:strand:+ start:92 stop:517 length:426 start_codon:yes stop_codon:yes gene_type:complete
MINCDVIKYIYTFDFTLPPINKDIRNYKNNIINNNVSKIQKWYKRNKIEKNMPILFINEMPYFQKWYIIRLYMKFYPKEDLRTVPYYILKKNNTNNLLNKLTPTQINQYNNNNFDSNNINCIDVFKFLKLCTKQQIINSGW